MALVIINTNFNRHSNDIVVLKVSSSKRTTQFTLLLTNENTKRKALKKESKIMVDFPVTRAKQTVLARPDKINVENLQEVKGKMKGLYQL